MINELATAKFNRRVIPAGADEYYWHAADGHAIRVIDWPEPAADTRPRGNILFMPGRGDFYEKYLESFEHWREQGWRVCAADWRGQAGSGRLGVNQTTGHIDDFATYVDDLAQMWRALSADCKGPLVLIAHSMGGHIALRGVIEGALQPEPQAVVLIAPMLDVLPEWVPGFVKRAYARKMASMGEPSRPAWKNSEKPGSRLKMRQMLLTHSGERYADEVWWRELRPFLDLGPGSWGWLKAAMESVAAIFAPKALESVNLPVLIVSTTADKLVSHAAIRRALKRLPNSAKCEFGKRARHEILRESHNVRFRAWLAIDKFLARKTIP